uniref:Uncharacterized protein n=1 Tax=Fundulus heteroclitus TaxID=8078 RepID=A0A146SK00_FUNHE
MDCATFCSGPPSAALRHIIRHCALSLSRSHVQPPCPQSAKLSVLGTALCTFPLNALKSSRWTPDNVPTLRQGETGSACTPCRSPPPPSPQISKSSSFLPEVTSTSRILNAESASEYHSVLGGWGWGYAVKACSQCGTGGLLNPRPLPATSKGSTEGKKTRQKAKIKSERAEQRGGRQVDLTPCFSQIWCPPATLLFKKNPRKKHPFNFSPYSASLRESGGFPCSRAASAYLQRRKPEVPSGPLGWRIT